MPLDVLLAIEHAKFPLMLGGEYELDCLRVLEAAQLVEVVFTLHPDDGVAVAMVLRITPMGRSEIHRSLRGAAQRTYHM